MKILFVISYVPLSGSIGPQGPKNLTYQTLSYLTENHDVDIIVLSSDEINYHNEMFKHFAKLKGYKQLKTSVKSEKKFKKFKSLLKFTPLTLGEYNSDELKYLLLTISSNYDIVHFDYYLLAENFYVIVDKIPTLLYSHDAYSLYYHYGIKYKNNFFEYIYYFVKEYIFINMENKYYNMVGKVLTVSSNDTNFLLKHGIKNVETLPIPIDINKNIELHKKNDQCTILLVCPYLSHSDIKLTNDFIEHYLNKLMLLSIEKVILFGSNVKKIKLNSSFSKLQLLEYSDNYENFLNQDMIYVYLRNVGSGLHTKLQDAMKFKLPIVGFTNLLSSLGGVDRKHYYACDNIHSIYSAIEYLAKFKDERIYISNNAYDFATKNYSLALFGDNLERIYAEIIHNFEDKNRYFKGLN